MKPAAVETLWPGETFVCIASGPSLTDADVNAVRDRSRVIVVNDNFLKAPWADVLYAADKDWWHEHDGVPSFQGLKYSIAGQGGRWAWPADIHLLTNTGREGLELQPTGIRTGSNSGYQAINLAVHLGAKRILLLGYDMQRTNGKLHWFGNHPVDLHRSPPFAEFLKAFPTLVKPLANLGIEIKNCSRQTALTCFERKTIDEALSVSVAA